MGAKAGVMGYPTPATPAGLTEHELILYINLTTELAQKAYLPGYSAQPL